MLLTAGRVHVSPESVLGVGPEIAGTTYFALASSKTHSLMSQYGTLARMLIQLHDF